MSGHQSQVLAIIPARIGSTRLAHKLLLTIDGITVLRRTVLQVQVCTSIDHVIVAIDDTRLIADWSDNLPDTFITDGDYNCGSDRCASVLSDFLDYDIIINVQGDQPFIDPAIIDLLAERMQQDTSIEIASLMTAAPTHVVAHQVVKVSIDNKCIATDFTRELREDAQYHHIGVYGYRRSVLQELATLPQSDREIDERLEQLRWLDHGYQIHMVAVDHTPHSIDVAADINRLHP